MIMKRLNGWMRIWIVLSVLFLGVGAFYGLKVGNETYYSYYTLSLSVCKERISQIKDEKQYSNEYDNCLKKSEKESKEYMEMGMTIPNYIFSYSVLPLLILWILGFISYKLYRWIRKGFEFKS